MMKKLFTIIICICAVTAQAQKPNNEALRKLQMAEFAITNLYVDKVDEDKLVEEAIIKMLAQLDPHSTYNNAEEVKKMNEPLQGNFEGIGVQFQMIEDTLLVIQPVSNGPSEKVGILAGDRIVAVNDSAIAGVKMSTEDIMSRLRGPKDSEVKLTIVRRGVDDQLYFTVKRDKIPILSLDASYMIQPKPAISVSTASGNHRRRVCRSPEKPAKERNERPHPRPARKWRRVSECRHRPCQRISEAKKNSSSTPKEGPHAAVISLPKVRATSRTAVSSYWWTSTPLLPVKS